MRSRLATPSRLVNIKTVPEMNHIDYNEAFGLRIGALTLLDQIEKDQIIRGSFNILAQAAGQIATPQIRNMGTIGGNLCQKPRCLYYRNPSFQCLRKGGKSCFVVRGENRYSAIIDGGPCFMVHPSDLAPALIALDARIKISDSDNEKLIPVESFFVNPKTDLHKENVLNSNEIISEIQIPISPDQSYGVYIKAMERKTWDFATVSVALQVCAEEDIVRDARLVIGGVSPSPFRLRDAEMLMKDKRIDNDISSQVSEIVVSVSRPLRDNGYKISLAISLIKQAMAEIGNKMLGGLAHE
jgi:xanthine dehydrogenase YagS FAD-binding subunit